MDRKLILVLFAVVLVVAGLLPGPAQGRSSELGGIALEPSIADEALIHAAPLAVTWSYSRTVGNVNKADWGWRNIVSQDFEGSFPAPWQVWDNDGAVNGQYYWGKRSCRPHAGSYSGWPLGAGANGASLPCGSSYPNNAESWMVYGPFSLADATAADLSFKLWLNTESGYDGLCRTASVDGTNFSGVCTSGGSGAGWTDRTLDLANVPTLGNLIGRQQVWVATVFISDSSVNKTEGAYVDSVVLRKYVPRPGGTGAPADAVKAREAVDDGATQETNVALVALRKR